MTPSSKRKAPAKKKKTAKKKKELCPNCEKLWDELTKTKAEASGVLEKLAQAEVTLSGLHNANAVLISAQEKTTTALGRAQAARMLLESTLKEALNAIRRSIPKLENNGESTFIPSIKEDLLKQWEKALQP